MLFIEAMSKYPKASEYERAFDQVIEDMDEKIASLLASNNYK